MHGAETLAFDDLAPYLLLRNGNFLYKIPFRGGFAVVKVYRGSRGTVETWRKSLQNLMTGQTSYRARTRLRVERECLDVWRKHGFRVYDTFDAVTIDAPQCPPGSYTVFEYRRGPSLNEHLCDESIPEETRFATFRRFLLEWGRRHALAIEFRETRLVHENGDGKHVMLFDDGLLWLDFEVIWTDASRVAQHVSHEIIQYLWQISKTIPERLRPRLLRETVAHYPDRERLRDAWRLFLSNPRALVRAARWLDRRTPRGRKPTSKYAVAERLRALLEAR
jgi:hypothetical protein